MYEALETLVPVIAALCGGIALGKLSRQRVVQSATRLISPLVTALLFSIGCEFGAVLTSPKLAGHSLISGATFAVCCTLTSWTLICCFYRQASNVTHPKSENRGHALTGATAMDATLPIVKLTCPENTIHHAIISGFALSVLSPVFLALFLGR